MRASCSTSSARRRRPRASSPESKCPLPLPRWKPPWRNEGRNAHNADAYAVEGHDEDAEKQHIGLRQRAAPLLHMLKDSLADGKDVVWEV